MSYKLEIYIDWKLNLVFIKGQLKGVSAVRALIGKVGGVT